MTTPTNHADLTATAENTIVAFHIGKGGHFHNPGHLSYLGEHNIRKYVDDLFITPENVLYIESKIGKRPNLLARLSEAVEGDADARSFFERIGMDLGEDVYTMGNGGHVGLSVAEAETGIGRINIDNSYDTTYTCLLSDCDEKEMQLIYREEKNSYYPDETKLSYLRWMLDIEEDSE